MKNKPRFFLLLLGAASFCFLAYLVMLKQVNGLDPIVSNFIRGFQSPELTAVMKAITYSANWQTITLLCLVFLILPKTRVAIGYVLALSSILTTSLNNLLKLLFHRVRPDNLLSLIAQGSYSFPSGHAMSGLVFYGLVIFLFILPLKNRPAKYCLTGLLSLLIFFIGVSRVYLGVHYPTDVLAGWSIGLCLLILFEYAADRFPRKHIRNE